MERWRMMERWRTMNKGKQGGMKIGLAKKAKKGQFYASMNTHTHTSMEVHVC